VTVAVTFPLIAERREQLFQICKLGLLADIQGFTPWDFQNFRRCESDVVFLEPSDKILLWDLRRRRFNNKWYQSLGNNSLFISRPD